jgi:hypothetical protein
MDEYVAHLTCNDSSLRTACGEPWQGWQAPEGLDPHSVILPPHGPPSGDSVVGIRQCGACMKAALADHHVANPSRAWCMYRKLWVDYDDGDDCAWCARDGKVELAVEGAMGPQLTPDEAVQLAANLLELSRLARRQLQ